MITILRYILFTTAACSLVSSASAAIVLHYEFNEADGTLASSAVNSGTSENTGALADGYGTMNGSGQLELSAASARINTSMGSDVFSGSIFYRIDFDSWSTTEGNSNFKFGFRLRSGETDTTQTNKFLEVVLKPGTGPFNGNITTAANSGRGSYDFIQGGIANPNNNGVSFIIGADTTTDTYSIWWDNQLTGTYSVLRDSIALNLSGETDFASVNALTFQAGNPGGSILIDRIALGNDFDEISAVPEPRTYALISGVVALFLAIIQRRRIS